MNSTHADRAKELFMSGYNCSQSVIGAFAEELGLDFETAVKLASPFGAGMGRMREVCGAVSGMFMVTGLANGYTDPKDREGKMKLYSDVRSLADEFKKTEGSIICHELLTGPAAKPGGDPEERTAQYYKKRPCPDIVYRAAQITEEYLKSLKDENKE